MAYTSEIEKLEARYRENPKGRNFAPLADAYRKAGLIDNAIELCQAGLRLHPDYVSGHIVHGRCLVDRKDDTGAEAVFRRVLDLDPENILALKVLAELAERSSRFEDAAEWLNRLLMADPMNGEAAEGLSRIRSKAALQPTQPTTAAEEEVATLLMEPEAPLEVVNEELEVEAPATASDSPLRAPRLSLENLEGPFAGLTETPTTAMDRPEFELERTSEPPLETFDGTIDVNEVAPEVATPEWIQLEEPEAVAPDPEVMIDGLARTQYEGSGMFKLDDPPALAVPTRELQELEERPTSPIADLPLILPDELDLPEPRAAMPTMDDSSDAAGRRATVSRPNDDDGAADTATLSQAEPVVTETMAELYLQQGHREDALRVYEALSAQRPHDARLRRKVADLSTPRSRPSGSGQSAGAFLKGILSARPGAPAPPPPPPPLPTPPAAPPPAPPESQASLGAPHAANPEPTARSSDQPQPSGPAPGSPTRPASDTISLDSVFGEEGGRGSLPVLPDPAPAQPSKLPEASGGFSFDDFFGTSAMPATESEKGNTSPNRPPRPSGRGRAVEQEEDLDQFQAWLKSLKA